MDMAASPVSVAVMGIARHRPDSSSRSLLPASLSTIPTNMNKVALNNACAMTSSAAAANAEDVPTPTSATIVPNWLTVE